MANENETVEQVCDEMRSFGNVPPPMFAWSYLADRAEAAHKRELDANDEEIIETNAQVENLRRLLGALLKKASPRCEKCEDVCDDCDCSYAAAVPVIKDAIAGVAIHKGDIDYMPLVKFAKNKDALEAKDAEIARLKRKNFDLNGCLLTEQELAENRDALIRELADTLNSYLIGECIDCGKRCEGDGACVHQKNLRALVKKSREVVSKTETTTEGGK